MQSVDDMFMLRIGPAEDENTAKNDLIERLSELQVTEARHVPRSRYRRASTNEIDMSPTHHHTQRLSESPIAETEMVWEWGKMPRETPLKHMLLERIHSDAPTLRNANTTSMQPIRRRRRYDSEPVMSHANLAPPIQVEQLVSSPLSETNTADSGTSSLSNNTQSMMNEAVVEDEEQSTVDPNEVSMSLCGGLLENNEIEDKDLFDRKIITYDEFNRSPKTYVANPLLIGKSVYELNFLNII